MQKSQKQNEGRATRSNELEEKRAYYQRGKYKGEESTKSSKVTGEAGSQGEEKGRKKGETEWEGGKRVVPLSYYYEERKGRMGGGRRGEDNKAHSNYDKGETYKDNQGEQA